MAAPPGGTTAIVSRKRKGGHEIEIPEKKMKIEEGRESEILHTSPDLDLVPAEDEQVEDTPYA